MKRETDPAATGLIFPWRNPPASIWRLLPYFIFCIGILAGLFLLFKISYPVTDPSPRLTQGLLMLDPDQPEHQVVLNRAYDQSALLLKSDTSFQTALNTPLLPLFRPSFQGYQMRLKETAQQETLVTAPRLFQPQDLALPAVSSFSRSTQAKAAPHTAASFALHLRFSGPLADRRLLSPIQLPEVKPQDLSRLHFHLTVNASGRVILALPLNSSAEDRPLIPQLQAALSQVRFAPVSDAAHQIDVASFVWHRLSAP